MLVERIDPLSIALRRVLILLLCAIVGGTWYAASAYTRSQLEQVNSEDKNAECNEIEEVGERYYGELSECRHEVAALRLRERK